VKLLEKFGVYKDYDVMVFDVLGDVVCGGFSAPLQHSEQVIIVATNDFDSIFAANRIATAITIKQKTGGGMLAGLVANRASNAELVGPFAERINSTCLLCIPENDGVRKSRLTAQTVFEMDVTGALGAPWMDLANRMLAGVPLTLPTPIPERELFMQLGADYVRAADIPAPAMAI
jgi:light-independent protochlorophyllide reductase subunit L